VKPSLNLTLNFIEVELMVVSSFWRSSGSDQTCTLSAN